MTEPPEFEPEAWVYVHAKTADAARQFVGAPPHWPVQPTDLNSTNGERVWRVQAEGLETGEPA